TPPTTSCHHRGRGPRPPEAEIMTGSPRRPTPKALAGRQDPALRVTPVDYWAVPRPPAVDSRDRGSDRGDRGDDSGPGQPSGRLPPPRSRGRPRSRPRTVELPRPAPAAPADAVHTLDAEDPRPRPRPLRLDAGELRTVGVEQVIDEQVVHTVADPEDAWTADAGNSDHFLRGELVVQVRRTDNAVIGVFSARYALAARPEDHQPALDIPEMAAGAAGGGGRRRTAAEGAAPGIPPRAGSCCGGWRRPASWSPQGPRTAGSAIPITPACSCPSPRHPRIGASPVTRWPRSGACSVSTCAADRCTSLPGAADRHGDSERDRCGDRGRDSAPRRGSARRRASGQKG